MNNLKLSTSLFALIAGSAIAMNGAMAQSAPANTESSGTPSVVETVTVTARRVSENLQRVPESVTVFSQKQLAEMGIVSMEDLQAVTPSMMVTNSSSNRDSSKYFIRGVGYGLVVMGRRPASSFTSLRCPLSPTALAFFTT